MKKSSLMLSLLLLGSALSFGAVVPVAKARNVGYAYLSHHGAAVQSAADLQLLYTAGAAPGYFYVFGNGSCFVMVAADDAVTPVLAYSTENTFRADNMPANISDYLQGYSLQVAFAVKNNVAPTADIATQWDNLVQNKATAAKTTATTVAPMITTLWDQGTYYDGQTPADATATSSGGHCVTGCVATAMAQVMKFWNWPTMGVGSSSYVSDYGTLSADFGSTHYNWFMMPNTVSSVNTAVAQLMAHNGIAVDMQYTAGESGAFVTESASPITNCAEYALKTYFNYKSTLHGIDRSAYTDATWVSTLKADLSLGHPVLVDGNGSAGGHNFVFDGYDASNYFHVNWGWSGASNGYFISNALNPAALGIGGGGGGFNSYQHAIIGIVPNGTPVTALLPDIYENNNTADSAYTLPLTWTGTVATKSTTGANFHTIADRDYYRVILAPGYSYTIRARVEDYASSDDGNQYTNDAKWAYSLNNGASWSATYQDTMPGVSTITVPGVTGDTVLFRVLPNISGTTGTYILKLSKVTRHSPTGIAGADMEDARVYPNPATEQLSIDLGTAGNKATQATLTDLQGRTVYNAEIDNLALVTIPVKGFAPGMYILTVATDNGTLTRKVTVGE